MFKYFKNIKSIDDLKSQYRKLAIKYHPDMGGDIEVMKAINIEYDILFPVWKDKYEGETGEQLNETSKSTRKSFYTQNGWEGYNYNAALSTTEIAAIIRKYCKEHFPDWKFSVTSSCFSGGSEINIAVMEAPRQIFNIDVCREEYQRYKNGDYYGRGLAIDVEKMLNDGCLHWQLHKINSTLQPYFTEYGYNVIENVFSFMQSYNYDDSDSMIDYFDCNFYYNIDIGSFKKPFKIVPKTARLSSPDNKLRATDYYSVSKSKHTKTGDDIWLVKINKNLSREEYFDESKKMRSLGGYYSKYTHSFIFKHDPSTII